MTDLYARYSGGYQKFEDANGRVIELPRVGTLWVDLITAWIHDHFKAVLVSVQEQKLLQGLLINDEIPVDAKAADNKDCFSSG